MSQEHNEGQNHDHNDHLHTLELTVDGTKHLWHQQYITGSEIRNLGKIPPEFDIFMAIKKPWEDELIRDEEKVDLAREGMEHFYKKKRLVTISIDRKKYEIDPGETSVTEIKTIGGVNPNYELEQVIDGKLTPLPDNGNVCIKGGEEFFSHAKDGSSS